MEWKWNESCLKFVEWNDRELLWNGNENENFQDFGSLF
jgi:hypothetical protein